MARNSSKSKALLKMEPYEKKNKSASIQVNIGKRMVDGKEQTFYSVANYGEGLPKEYTEIDNFINDCLVPNVKSFSKKIG